MKNIVISISLLFLLSCGSDENIYEKGSEKEANRISFTTEQLKMAGIQTSEIEYKKMTKHIFCTGRLEVTPQNRANISVPIEGYVKNINVLKGQNVKQNAVLITLQNPVFVEKQKNYLQTKEQHDLLLKEYNRQKVLNENKAGTGKIFEQSIAELNELKIELEASKLELSMINIDANAISADNIKSSIPVLSPINGIINEMNVTIGQYIKPDDMLMEIIGNDDFHIVLDVFEKEINKVNIGQDVIYECNIPESDTNLHIAEIYHIGNYIDDISKTFKVIAKPSKIYPGMRHGIFLTAKIQLSEENYPALTEEAVLSEGDDRYIFLADSDTSFVKQYVKIGIVDQGYISILSPGMKGKKVVVKGSNYLNAELNAE